MRGGETDVLNLLDDHSRLALASLVGPTTTGPAVTDTFTTAFARWGAPASVLTHNGAIFAGATKRPLRKALGPIL